MPVYLGLFSLLVLVALSVSDRRSGAPLAIALLFLFLFVGFRDHIGCDFTGYLNRFINFDVTRGLDVINWGVEPFFDLIVLGVKASGLSYMWLNVAAAAVFIVNVGVFVRGFKNPLMILALLFPILVLQLGMSGIRQALAVSFLMVAAKPFMQGRRVATAAWILVGMQFHASVIVMLPMALLAGRDFSVRRVIAGLMILGPVAGLLLGDRLGIYSDRYIEQIYGDSAANGAWVRYALLLIPAFLYVRYRKLLLSQHPDMAGLFQMTVLLSFSLWVVGVVSTIALHRLIYYVMPFSIVMFVYLSLYIFRRSDRVLGRFAPAAVYGLYSVVWLLTSKHAGLCYIPYNNYLIS